MNAEEAVETLPGTVATIAESIAGFQGQLLRQSLLAASGQRVQPAWTVAAVIKLNLRLYLTRSSDKTTFLFRKRRRTEVVLDTDLAIDLRPSFRGEDEPPSPPSYSMAGIPFVREDLDPAELRRRSSPEATPQNTVVFSLEKEEESLLIVVHPRDKNERKIFHWVAGKKTLLSGQDKRWPLLPFWRLLEVIRAWIATGIDDAPAVPVTDFVVEETSIQEIVDSAKRSYARLRFPLDPASGPLSPALADFHFRVTLRVDPNGRVTEKDGKDPFQIRFSMREVSTGRPGELRLSVGPPDFLVSGKLLEAFRNVMLGERPTLLHNLRFHIARERGALAPSLEELREFIRSAFERGQTSVFRIRREYRDIKDFPDLEDRLRKKFEEDPGNIDFEEGKKRVIISLDTDIVALRGTDRQVDSILIFSAPFRVVPRLGERAVDAIITQSRPLKILYSGPVGAGRVDEEFVEYFFHLAANLKTWTRLL